MARTVFTGGLVFDGSGSAPVPGEVVIDGDRVVETLPSPPALAEREARGEPLTRAELGVLLA